MSAQDDSSDDEFDELFSFNTAAASSPDPTKAVKTSSPINFDLSEQEVAANVTTAAASANAMNSASAHTSDTSSYYKVSPTQMDPMEAVDDDDGVFGDFDLDAVKLKNTASEGLRDDDFHAMDSDTRDFLDFLDEPTKTTSTANIGVNDSSDMDDAKGDDLDDDSDDGMMDFVDIDQDTSTGTEEVMITSAVSTRVKVVAVNEPALMDVSSDKAAEREVKTVSTPSKESNASMQSSEEFSTMAKEATTATSPSPSPNQGIKPLAYPKRQSSTASASQYQSNSILSAMDSNDLDSSSIEKGEGEDMNQVSAREDFSAAAASIIPEKKEIVFDTLSEATHSAESSMNNIRPLLYPYPNEIARVENEERPWLWSKAICSKTLSDVESSSLADSFTSWDEIFDMSSLLSGANGYGLLEEFVKRLLQEVDILSKRIISSDSGTTDVSVAKRDVCSLLLFYYRSNSIAGKEEELAEVYAPDDGMGLDDSLVLEEDVTENLPMIDENEEKSNKVTTKEEASEPKPKGHYVEWNSLIGPVAATLLASGITSAAASVMLSRIVPASMPLISLTKFERMHAVKTLHQKLYYLSCYHLPLLVLHLDRYVPGWHWPHSTEDDEDLDLNNKEAQSPTKKSRNLEAQGVVPITWFSSLLAGEGSAEALETNRLLVLWDVLLTSNDQSLKFFLALSVLERHSDNLLMLKGQELVDEITAVMSLNRNEVEVESFLGGSSAKEELSEAQSYVLIWCNHAGSLRETTPFSVFEYLRFAEDSAVMYALNLRSKLAMEKMKTRLEAEAEAHRRAAEEENAKKLDARMRTYYKERLEKYYKKHCPEKVGTVDLILEVYKDRYHILDSKLQEKYGRGFLPLISVFHPKVSSQTSKIISNVNQGIELKKKSIVAARAEERAKLYAEGMGQTRHQVAIKIAANEIMPIVCGGKASKLSATTREPLKYYLVDSRPAENVKIQGAFPTAARLSPEDLMDPEQIQEKVEMFESLRGAVHICIMGEGFSSFPTLYGHPLDKNEQKLLDSDESRTSKYQD